MLQQAHCIAARLILCDCKAAGSHMVERGQLRLVGANRLCSAACEHSHQWALAVQHPGAASMSHLACPEHEPCWLHGSCSSLASSAPPAHPIWEQPQTAGLPAQQHPLAAQPASPRSSAPPERCRVQCTGADTCQSGCMLQLLHRASNAMVVCMHKCTAMSLWAGLRPITHLFWRPACGRIGRQHCRHGACSSSPIFSVHLAGCDLLQDQVYIHAHTLRPTRLMHWLQGETSKHWLHQSCCAHLLPKLPSQLPGSQACCPADVCAVGAGPRACYWGCCDCLGSCWSCQVPQPAGLGCQT